MTIRPIPSRQHDPESSILPVDNIQLATSHPHPTPPQLPLRIITHNIRYAANESERSHHERPWSERLVPFAQQLHFLTRLPSNPAHSILCVQECLTEQFNDVASSLGAAWTGVGVGRDDGKEKGERCAVFYRSGYWCCLHYETVWLNEDGTVGKKGWDAGCVRVVTCLVLEARQQVVDQLGFSNSGGRHGKKILLMNTHLDNSGRTARLESAKILLRVKQKLMREWNVDAVVLAGDLNSKTDGRAYLTLTGKSSGFVDAKHCVKDQAKYGDENTFSGFGPQGDGEKVNRIDFVFLGEGKLGQDNVQGYSVMPNAFEAGVWMSDHRAVVVDSVL